MLISDLNYLNEVSSESTDLSGGFNLKDNSYVYFDEKFNLFKKFETKVRLEGNTATFESDANAVGKYTVTQTFGSANVIAGVGSSSNSAGFAAATNKKYYY